MKDIIILSMSDANADNLRMLSVALKPLTEKFGIAVLNSEIKAIDLGEFKGLLEGMLEEVKRLEAEHHSDVSPEPIPLDSGEVIDVDAEILGPLRKMDELKGNAFGKK